MRRIQFIEIHEQSWLPSLLRDQVTDALRFGMNLFHAYAPIAPRLQGALDATDSRSIIDLCSGGGGPWISLFRKLRGELRGELGELQVLLTDKYPNLGTGRNGQTAGDDRIRAYAGSVDAMSVPCELKGLRTMFTSFHHFSPDEARAILQNAVDAREGIAVFEITRRAPVTIGFMFPFVAMLSAGTLWIRPFRWSRLFWTYLIPIVPFILLFDGVVSCLRTYRPRELREIIEKIDAPGYCWEIGEQASGRLPITLLIGCPQSLAREQLAES